MNSTLLWYDIQYGALILIFFALVYFSYRYFRGMMRARKATNNSQPVVPQPVQSMSVVGEDGN
jgi:hypothetical protein